jgi:hypothetical protein
MGILTTTTTTRKKSLVWLWPLLSGAVMGSLLTNSFWMLQTASRSTLVQQQHLHATDDPALSSEQSAEQHRNLLHNDHPHYFEQLMYKYGSDKSKDDHGYTDLYQMLLDPVRHGIQNVTEVGVSAGQGLYKARQDVT